MSLATLSLSIIVGAALLIIGLERLWPFDRGQRLFRDGFWTDLVLYTFLQSYVLSLLISWLIATLDAGTGLSRLRVVSGWPVPAQLLFFFVLHDFYIYWFHRLQHRLPILWRIHEAHHSVRDVDWLAGSRSHALEILINQTVEFAPIVLLGAAPEVAVLKGTLDAVWGMWIHSNVNVRSGRLQYLLNGPEMHRWHHALEPGPLHRNFATKLAVWDWLFGTAFRPADARPGRYGLGADDFPEDYVGQQLRAFRR